MRRCAEPPPSSTAPAAMEAALRAGIHCFDLTAKQPSVRQPLARHHDEARQRGSVVIPAVALHGGLADLRAAERSRGARSVERSEVGMALDCWHPTAGTRRTAKPNTVRRFIVADGRFTPLPRRAPVRHWAFPAPFGVQQVVAVPLAEIVATNRHIGARSVCSYLNTAPLRDLEHPPAHRNRLPPIRPAAPRSSSSWRFAPRGAIIERRLASRDATSMRSVHRSSSKRACACWRIRPQRAAHACPRSCSIPATFCMHCSRIWRSCGRTGSARQAADDAVQPRLAAAES